jgi:CubicO group peptidase (beta-lactamase class C family)
MKSATRDIIRSRFARTGIQEAVCKILFSALLPLVLFSCARQAAQLPATAPAAPPAKIAAAAAPPVPPPLNHKDIETLDADLQGLIPPLMKKARIPGLQMAIIRDGQVVLHHDFGVRNAESPDPVTDDTIFEAASLTKPFFAYYVMKLVDQGVISLDKPLLSYIPAELIEQPLGHPLSEPGFRRDWFEKITPRHVLSHSSGMPHGESGKPYPLFFEPGTKWKYSADGYFFLQKVVEYLKGDKLENLMQKEVLDPLGMTRSCMVWKSEYEKTMANGHELLGKPEAFRKRTEADAAATLYTTAEDYAKFVAAVLSGRDLRPETFKEMLTPQIDMDKDKGLGWSLGFGTQTDRNGLAIWQWGDFGIFRSYVIAYPGEKSGVVYLSNSFSGLAICSDIVGRALGGLAQGSVALGYWPYDSPKYQFAWDLEAKGPRAAKKLPGLTRKYPDMFNPEFINFLVESFQEADMARQALAILEVNLKEHPRSGSARFELAKAYLAMGKLKRARRDLIKARLAEEDKVEAAVIDWHLECINGLEKPLKLEEEYLKKIAGDYGARHLQLKDGRLYYFRDGGAYPEGRPLTAISHDTFFMEHLLRFRIKVEFDANGNPVKLIGLYIDGTPQDESIRDK